MKRTVIILIILTVLLKMAFADDVSYRQTKFHREKKCLLDEELENARRLNKKINAYNEAPSIKILQEIEDLKNSIIDNLQEQITHDTGYIDYLELRLSEFTDEKPPRAELKDDPASIKEAAKRFIKETPSLKFEE